MRKNPLLANLNEIQVIHETKARAYDPHQFAKERNAQLKRNDIEWIVTDNGELRLIDKPSYTAWNTKDIKRHRELDRQEYLRRYRETTNKTI